MRGKKIDPEFEKFLKRLLEKGYLEPAGTNAQGETEYLMTEKAVRRARVLERFLERLDQQENLKPDSGRPFRLNPQKERARSRFKTRSPRKKKKP